MNTDHAANDLVFMPAYRLAESIRDFRYSAVEVLEAHLEQIARHNKTVNAIVTLDEEGARRHAKEADAALARGEIWGPLHGIPVTLKDVHDTMGMLSTHCHPSFADRVPAYDGVVTARLRDAGAIIFGKTNFQHYPDSPFGETFNPWDHRRTTGGSSAGSAAAVAAGLSPLDIGSDIGGSITVPSHCCGVYAMRPTERRVPVSRYPTDFARLWRFVLAYGPLARSVDDLRLALQVIVGGHDLDPEVPPLQWSDPPHLELKDLKIAWTSVFPGAKTIKEIQTVVESLAVELEAAGAQVEQCLPEVNIWNEVLVWSRLVYQILLPAGGKHFKTPTPPILIDYLETLELRDHFIAAWEQFFSQWDVLLSPAFGTTAWLVDGPTPGNEFSLPAPLSAATGHPAIVLPVSQDENNLPIGIQLMGRRWHDERLLAIAEAIANYTDGFQRPPGY